MDFMNNFLIALAQSMGDVFLCTGVFDGLKKKYPGCSIDFITRKVNFPILEDNKHIRNLYVWDESVPYNVEVCDNPLINEIAKNYQYVFTPARWIQNEHMIYFPKWYAQKKFWALSYAERCDGVEYNTPTIKIDENYKQCLKKFGVKRKYITMQTQTTTDPRSYDRRQGLAVELQNKYSKEYDIVNLGGGADKEIDGVINIMNQDIRIVSGILKEAALHIGIDSFQVHIAAAMGTKVVEIYGGSACEWATPSFGDVIAIVPDYEKVCPSLNQRTWRSGCHYSKCVHEKNDMKCINTISPQYIISVVDKVLNREFFNKEVNDIK